MLFLWLYPDTQNLIILIIITFISGTIIDILHNKLKYSIEEIRIILNLIFTNVLIFYFIRELRELKY